MSSFGHATQIEIAFWLEIFAHFLVAKIVAQFFSQHRTTGVVWPVEPSVWQKPCSEPVSTQRFVAIEPPTDIGWPIKLQHATTWLVVPSIRSGILHEKCGRKSAVGDRIYQKWR